MSFISIKNMRKQFSDTIVPLKDVSCEINKGDVISIIGPSGTGKSTLIRCLNMLAPPTSGTILLDGEEITAPACDMAKLRQKVGMVFQSFNLFDHKTVVENVMMAPMDLLGMNKRDAYQRAMELLTKVGMESRARNYPEELSGGQKQRVAIARALAMDPEVILFDEPTSALDPMMTYEVEAVIKNIAETGVTMLIVTHEMRFAREVANRVFYMDEGGIYEDGSPEQIFDHPTKPNTIAFIRQIKSFERDLDLGRLDLFEVTSQIADFGKEQQFSRITNNHLQLLFEEYAVGILKAGGVDRLRFAIQHSQKDESITVTFRFPGTLPEEEALSAKIIESITSSSQVEALESGETLVTMELR